MTAANKGRFNVFVLGIVQCRRKRSEVKLGGERESSLARARAECQEIPIGKY